MKALQTFEPNLVGRDFMVGDLHGSLTLLSVLLDGIGFDYQQDRLFSAGDLVDRGPDHLLCLALLREPWFYAVRANHEEMLIAAAIQQDNELTGIWMMNGGLWALESVSRISKNDQLLPEDLELIQLAKLADELPYLITVKQKNGERVHLVHAELPPILGVADVDLENEEFVLQLAKYSVDKNKIGIANSVRSHMLWGRDIFLPFYREDLTKHERVVRQCKYNKNEHWQGLSRVVSGHTVVQRPLSIFNFTCIDTGAFDAHRKKWAGLTCVELDTWTFYRARFDGVEQIDPVVVNSYPNDGEQNEADSRS